MARFNEILVGRYNRLVQKLFSMKGPASLVTISDEMMAVFPFFHGAENRYLEAWAKFGVTLLQPAVALNASGIRLRNPTGSNVVAVLEKILISNQAVADDVTAQLNGAAGDLATVAASGQRFDVRGVTASTLIPSRAAPAASIGGGFLRFTFPANALPVDVITADIQEIPLLPGDAIQIFSNNVNQALLVNFLWRERFLEDSERA